MKNLILLLILSGCGPHLTQQSVAPPGRQANLNAVTGFWGIKHYQLKISEGVAIAITCDKAGPCENTKLASANPAIAEVRSASLAKLQSPTTAEQQQMPLSAFVVVGKSPGTTRIRVSSKGGERDVFVTVSQSPQNNWNSDEDKHEAETVK